MTTSPNPTAGRWHRGARRTGAPRGSLWTRRAISALVVLSMVLGLLTELAEPAAAKTRPLSLGIDVAAHQHPGGVAINWRQVRSSGVKFVIIKATEGAGRAKSVSTNPYFIQDWKGAQAAGLQRAAYHYARPRYPLSTAVTDARRFVQVIKGAGRGTGELAPVLDLEETGGLSAKAISSWASSWLKEVTRLTGRTPIIYTGRGYWTSYLANTTKFASYPLWYAHHTTAVQPAPPPGGWKSWTFWQYSATGHVSGIKTAVDLNWSCGSPGTTSTRSCAGAATHQKAVAKASAKPVATKTTSTKSSTTSKAKTTKR